MIKSNVTRRSIVGGLAAGLGIAAAGSNDLIGAARAQSARKTFVVIPGAFNGGWVWHRVSDQLEKKGHKVLALTLTGLGERSHLLSKDINLDTHITDIVNVIKWERLEDFCLVAHSYGGLIARLYASAYPDEVFGLVLVDALSEGLRTRRRRRNGRYSAGSLKVTFGKMWPSIRRLKGSTSTAALTRCARPRHCTSSP